MVVSLCLVVLILSSFQFNFSCMWTFCLHVCLCTTCMYGAHRDQKRVSDTLKLELHTVVDHHEGIESGSPRRAASAL